MDREATQLEIDEYDDEKRRMAEVFTPKLRQFLKDNPPTPEISLEMRVHEFLGENVDLFEQAVNGTFSEEFAHRLQTGDMYGDDCRTSYRHPSGGYAAGDGDASQTSGNASSSTHTQTQLSSSFMSSYVNNNSVGEILHDLLHTQDSSERLEALRRLTQLAKSDTSIDFFSETIVNQISRFLEDDDESVNEAALVFHASILLNSSSHLFIYQAFHNLIQHIAQIPREHLTTIGAFKRLRLILDFFEHNFEMSHRVPSWFVQEMLEDFLTLVTDFDIFANISLFSYKWFERFFLKTQFRRAILEYSNFNDFLQLIKSIIELKHPRFRSQRYRDQPKLKTLIVKNSLEIATTCACFEQISADDYLLSILASFAGETPIGNSKTVRKAAISAFLKLAEKGKVSNAHDFPGFSAISKAHPKIFANCRKRKRKEEVVKVVQIPWGEQAKGFSRHFKRSDCPAIYGDREDAGVLVTRKCVFEMGKRWHEKCGENVLAAVGEIDKILNAEGRAEKFVEYFREHGEREFVRLTYKNVPVSQIYQKSTDALLTNTPYWQEWLSAMRKGSVTSNTVKVTSAQLLHVHFQFCIGNLYNKF